jgi:RNA polymerase sigma factor (sigma-70 family)
MGELYNLIKNAKNREGEATLELITKFEPLIKKYSRKLNYYGDNTDLVISFIEIIDKIPIDKNEHFTSDECIVGYINTCFKNKYIYLSKKNQKQNNIEVPINFDITKDEPSINTENEILILLLLDKLPIKEKNIIIKKFFLLYTDVEIAQELHLTRQAVNKSKNMALKNLKKYMEEVI